jgi:hypothetical protein
MVGMGVNWIKSPSTLEIVALSAGVVGVAGGRWMSGGRGEFAEEGCQDGAIVPAKARRRGCGYAGRSR